MQVGVHFMNFSLPSGPAGLRAAVGDTAVAAEEAGCAVFTAMDHWFQMEHFADAREPMLEGYSVLNFVAAKTERIRLGLLVTGVTYRHPGLLAKTVTTLDVLSGGRAMLGIGAAWYEREHLALGVPYPPVAERFERLEEAIQICEQMWSDDDGPYNGRYYQLAETICVPRPLQTPRPPILIGGGGEKKTLRLVAQYADACNLFATSVEETKRKLDILRGHCDAVGRDYDSIAKTIIGRVNLDGDVSGFLAEMEQYAALGITLVEVAPTMPDPARFVTQLGDKVVRPLAEIG
jgi:F420-dependent oxidoreductase-like protein